MLRRLVQRGIFAILLVMVSWAQAGEPPLKSESFLVADARSLERIALRGDPAEPMPIASITKLMTAMVVLESRLPLDETITVGQEDIDTLKGTRSRLPVGTASPGARRSFWRSWLPKTGRPWPCRAIIPAGGRPFCRR